MGEMDRLLSGEKGSKAEKNKASLKALSDSMRSDAKKSTLDKAKKLGLATVPAAAAALDVPRALVHRATGGVSDNLRTDRGGVGGFLQNTAVDIVEDPLTYLTFGTKDLAKQGLKVAGEELGKDVARDIAKRGTKRALTNEGREKMLQAIMKAENGGSAKAADKTMKALDRGAQGGVKVAGHTVVPGSAIRAAGGAVADPVANLARRAASTRPVAAVAEAPGVAAILRGAQNAAEATVDAAKGAKAALTPRAAIAANFGDAAEQVDSARAISNAAGGHGADEVTQRVADMVKATKATDDELRNIVLPALDQGGAFAQAERARMLDELLGVTKPALVGASDENAQLLNELRGINGATPAPAESQLLNELRGINAPPPQPRRVTPEEALEQIPARLRPLVSLLAEVRAIATDKQATAGILPGERETATYIPRDFPDHIVEKVLNKRPGAGTGGGSTLTSAAAQGGHIRGRSFMPDAPLLEVEAAIRAMPEFKALPKRLQRKPVVETNPAVALAARAARAERAVASKQFLDDVMKIDTPEGKLLDKFDKDTPLRDGWEVFDAGPFGTFQAPRSIVKELRGTHEVISNPNAMHEFGKTLHELNTLWKGYATVPLVGGFGYHARNATGNIWNNSLRGVKPPSYAHATAIQAKMLTGKPLSPQHQEWFRLAKKHGVLDSGFFLNELTDAAAAGGRIGRAASGKRGGRHFANQGGRYNPRSTENVVIRSGRAVGSAIEQNARLAHFIHVLKETGDPDAAARSVRKYLFDYSDITEAERELKKVAGFYTFMRKNTPLQIREMAKQPGKFAGVGHAYNQAAGMTEPGDMPDWALREGMIPIGGMGVGVDLPPAAALEAASAPLRPGGWTSLASGFLPALVRAGGEELMGGKSMLTGNPDGVPALQRYAEAAMPLIGKVRRSPQVSAINDRDQALARLITALTGLPARNFQ